MGLIVWQVTKTGYIAIVFSILADGMASLPTLIKSFHNPETESGWPYLATVISAVITLLVARDYSLSSIGFTIYLFVVCLIIFTLVQFKVGRIFKKITV